MTAAEVTSLTAAGLQEEYRAGTLSPREAVGAFLERIAEVDPELNAFCWVDAEESSRQAAESERRYLAGRALGPLDGVPVAVKDTLLTRGWPTLRGSRTVVRDQPWTEDAPSVRRLRANGAVLVGKTTTPEFGWKAVTDSPLTGVTRNPWAVHLSPGGSSGGSAVAVASGMAPLALGTDGGGSIRIPSSFCGTVGLKPTFGRVPQWPESPFAELSHLGPIARTAADAATLLSVIADPDPKAAAREPTPVLAGGNGPWLQGVRIAFSSDLGYVELDDEIAAAAEASAGLLESLGAAVTRSDPGFDDPIDAFTVLWSLGLDRATRHLGAEQRSLMDPGMLEMAAQGARLAAEDYRAALEEKTRLTALVEGFFEDFDALVTPTLPIAGLPAGQEVPDGWPQRRWTSWTPFTYPFNLCGVPATSVPCGFSSIGLPIGLQIIGPRHADELVLLLALAFEEAVALTDRRPVLTQTRVRSARPADAQ
jgi:aspartyl-tRNA(Asn)/glutamyl-tRNA(Gln) amidotransferase subunit A